MKLGIRPLISAAVVIGALSALGGTSAALAAPQTDSCASQGESRSYWDPSVFYNEGDTVNYNEKLYRALGWNHGKNPSDTSWWIVAECASADPTKNVARDAVATASSEYGSTYGASKAIDGIVGQNGVGEWASNGESTPSITLTWNTPRVIDEIRVFDRPNSWDWASRGTLTFSDGSKSEYVVWIDNRGTVRTSSFTPREVTWVKLQIDDGSGNVGLSEIEAYHRGTVAPATPNVASQATASASSAFDPRYTADKAIDGIVGQNAVGEWASKGELTPSITLNWSGAQTVNQVTLADRSNLIDNVKAGVLTFSDGSTIAVGALPNDGTPQKISFTARQVSWATFRVTEGAGGNVGLSEFEARRSN